MGGLSMPRQPSQVLWRNQKGWRTKQALLVVSHEATSSEAEDLTTQNVRANSRCWSTRYSCILGQRIQAAHFILPTSLPVRLVKEDSPTARAELDHAKY